MSFGPHVSREHASGKRPNISEHIEVARRTAETETGFQVKAVAIFVGGPRTKTITMSPVEQHILKEYIAKTKIKVYAHSAYCAHPWGGDAQSADFIKEEQKVCEVSGITGLVIHLPKQPAEVVIRYLPTLINQETPNVRLFLETPAVTPKETYYETPEKLENLFNQIRATVDPQRVGLCIDTAHLWTNGEDISTYENARNWLSRLEATSIDPERIMIHLNDSEKERGKGPDTHAALGAGKIWKTESGLAAFVEYAVRNNLSAILERSTKEGLANDYRVLRSLTPA